MEILDGNVESKTKSPGRTWTGQGKCENVIRTA